MSYFNTIRAAVVARLIAHGVAGGNVNSSQAIPGEDDMLPAVNVYTLSGSGERNAGNANNFDAVLTVNIDCFATGTSDEDLAENVASLVDDVMDAIFTDHELAALMKLKSYNVETDLSIQGRERMAGAQLRLTGEYQSEYAFTFPNDLDGINVAVIHDGKEIDATIDMETT